MYTLYRTRAFIVWLDGLKDDKAVALINRRLLMLAKHEHFGDAKRRGKQIVLLLCGGDKRSQKRDIEKAIELAESTEIEQ